MNYSIFNLQQFIEVIGPKFIFASLDIRNVHEFSGFEDVNADEDEGTADKLLV
jgi:hypothetical protein